MHDCWILLALWASLVAMDTTGGPQWLYSDPIVAAPVAGWIVGDISAGFVIGIVLQLAWSVSVPAGSSRFLDVQVASMVGTALAANAGGGPEGWIYGFVWVIPVGFLGSVGTVAERRCFGLFARWAARPGVSLSAAAWLHRLGLLVSLSRGFATAAVGMSVGALFFEGGRSLLDGVDVAVWIAIPLISGAAFGIAARHSWRRPSPIVLAIGAGVGAIIGVLAPTAKAWL